MVQRRRSMRQAVGNEWTMDSPTGWVAGEGEDERKVKVHSTSTDSRPVPSHASAQGPPQASPGGDPGGGGAVSQFSSPLPRGVLGGWAALITGSFHWQRTREPNDAAGRFSAASGPCCECESLFRDHEKEEGQKKQTDKRANSPTFPRHRHRVSPSARSQACPSSTRASFRRPSDSFECRLRLLLQSTCSSLQTTNEPAGATLPSTSNARISRKVNCNCRFL